MKKDFKLKEGQNNNISTPTSFTLCSHYVLKEEIVADHHIFEVFFFSKHMFQHSFILKNHV